MNFKVGIGKSDFEALRKSNNYYVDKTAIIYELVEETDHQVTLFTRPRRFGKTLMMSMMAFLQIGMQSEMGDLLIEGSKNGRIWLETVQSRSDGLLCDQAG